MKRIYIISGVVVILGIISFLIFYKKAEAPNIVVPIDEVLNNENKPLVFATSSRQIVKDTYGVDFRFPIAMNQKMDAEIMRMVNGMVSSFEKEAQSFSPNPTLSDRRYTLTNSVIPRFGNKYDTYVFLVSVDFGGAHPNHFYKTLTFNKNRELVSLEDVLNEDFNGIESLEVISKLTKEYLYDKLGEGVNPEMIERGTQPTLENFKSFYVTEDQIVFLFEPYAVAPYSYSTQEVKLDFSEIKN